MSGSPKTPPDYTPTRCRLPQTIMKISQFEPEFGSTPLVHSLSTQDCPNSMPRSKMTSRLSDLDIPMTKEKRRPLQDISKSTLKASTSSTNLSFGTPSKQLTKRSPDKEIFGFTFRRKVAKRQVAPSELNFLIASNDLVPERLIFD